MRQTCFHLYQIHGLIINIVLHLLHDQTCNNTNVAVHKFHSPIILFDLHQLDHSFLQIIQISIQTVQTFDATGMVCIFAQFFHNLLCILYLSHNVIQFTGFF